MLSLDMNRIPAHIAIIMDGNGRWAKQKGFERIFGHRNALKAVRETIETSARLQIKYLTLYAFSTENWSRPKHEVDALMELLVNAIRKETETLLKNNIKLNTIGNINDLPPKCVEELQKSIAETAHNTGLQVNLALSYSGRWEIVEAVKRIGFDIENHKVKPQEITDALLKRYMTTHDMPDPELVIRTSGEMRISNFLLWQIAYAEFFFTDVLWPDFRKETLMEAIKSFQERDRRFGGVSKK